MQLRGSNVLNSKSSRDALVNGFSVGNGGALSYQTHSNIYSTNSREYYLHSGIALPVDYANKVPAPLALAVMATAPPTGAGGELCHSPSVDISKGKTLDYSSDLNSGYLKQNGKTTSNGILSPFLTNSAAILWGMAFLICHLAHQQQCNQRQQLILVRNRFQGEVRRFPLFRGKRVCSPHVLIVINQ